MFPARMTPLSYSHGPRIGNLSRQEVLAQQPVPTTYCWNGYRNPVIMRDKLLR